MAGRLLVPLVASAVLAACGAPRTPPPTATRAVPATATDGAGCARCHAEIAREWAASFHRVSFTDATYQKSLAMEAPPDRAWCNGCHAPRAPAISNGETAGVDCTSCHGPRYASPHGAESAKTAAPVRCVPCHEFPFPGRPELVQKTASEHAASTYAEVACATCHLPRNGGHRDHRFALAGHDPVAVARTVHLEAAPAATDALRVVIRSEAGHAFPTGVSCRPRPCRSCRDRPSKASISASSREAAGCATPIRVAASPSAPVWSNSASSRNCTGFSRRNWLARADGTVFISL